MTLGVAIAVRNTKMAAMSAAVDAGSGSGFLRMYDGTRPMTGGTATTLLAQLTFSSTSFGAPTAGSIIANTIASNNAVAAGNATWFRITDSLGSFVLDGSVGGPSSGADLELNNVTIAIGVLVDVTAMTLTDGDS